MYDISYSPTRQLFGIRYPFYRLAPWRLL